MANRHNVEWSTFPPQNKWILLLCYNWGGAWMPARSIIIYVGAKPPCSSHLPWLLLQYVRITIKSGPPTGVCSRLINRHSLHPCLLFFVMENFLLWPPVVFDLLRLCCFYQLPGVPHLFGGNPIGLCGFKSIRNQVMWFTFRLSSDTQQRSGKGTSLLTTLFFFSFLVLHYRRKRIFFHPLNITLLTICWGYWEKLSFCFITQILRIRWQMYSGDRHTLLCVFYMMVSLCSVCFT